MKAAVIEEFGGSIAVQTVADPACPADGAIIAVKSCGVCRSDWHGWKGADPDIVLPHVPGHEFAGEIVEVGPECRDVHIGQRITAPFILGCGTCADCKAGQATICAAQEVVGFTSWGAFASYVAVPRADFNLVPLPETLDFDAAAGMGCRVTTAFRGLVLRGRLRAGESVAIHGCGGIGLSAILIARAIGAETIAIDVNPAALEMAKILGADHCVQVEDQDDVGAAIRAQTKGGVDVSVDALGITSTYLNSLHSLRKLGRHVQIGMPLGPHATPPLPLLELVYSRQIEVIGTRGMAAAQFGDLFDLLARRDTNIADLITARIPLSAAGNAVAAMDQYSAQGITVITNFDD